MARNSKYKGGSCIATFRLPIQGFKSTRVRVQALLDQIASEMSETGENTPIPMVASPETTLTCNHTYTSSSVQTNDIYKDTNETVYGCGCVCIDTLFRRMKGCRVPRGEHNQ